jgi:hypothetical protein
MTEEKKRQGSWAEVKTWQDPDSGVSLILSERIRGKHAYSFQIVHEDNVGMNKYVPMHPDRAQHEIEHIVFSLVREARQFIAEQEQKDG